jgi:hypothetical protein
MTLFLILAPFIFSAGFAAGAAWVLYRVKTRYIVVRDYGPEW